MKYLGVWLDDTLTWRPHFENMSKKAIKVAAKMTHICRNTYGYSNKARLIMLEGTNGAMMQYVSSAFAHRLAIAYNIT